MWRCVSRVALVLLLGAAGSVAAQPESPACRPEGERGAAHAESCAIDGSDYRLVRASVTVSGSVAAAVAALRNMQRCPESTCIEERSADDDDEHSITHRVRGSGFTRRVTVTLAKWWRLPGERTVLDIVGVDHMKAAFRGTRIRCLRERWTLVPGSGARVAVTQEMISDPQPPFGLTSLVTAPTAEAMLAHLGDLAAQLERPSGRTVASTDSFPLRQNAFPELGVSFVRCQQGAGLWEIDIDVQALLAEIDRQRTFGGQDFAAVMTLTSEDPEDGVERTVVQQFRRDADDAFLILIRDPAVQRGQGYLRQGDNLWFYDTESRKFSRTSLKEAFQGTDARNSDFGDISFAEDYAVRWIEEGTLGRYAVYVLDLQATSNEVTYPFLKAWVTREGSLVLKTEDYSVTERLVRTSYYPRYARVGDAVVPTEMIFVDEMVEGKKTRISMSDLSDAEIPDSVFTKAYVERANR